MSKYVIIVGGKKISSHRIRNIALREFHTMKEPTTGVGAKKFYTKVFTSKEL